MGRPVAAPGWRDRAACLEADPEMFFPEKGGMAGEARLLCWGDGPTPACPVRRDCLAHALDHRERFGVWGGYTERERRELARVYRAVRAA